jgi:hypothetical protein
MHVFCVSNIAQTKICRLLVKERYTILFSHVKYVKNTFVKNSTNIRKKSCIPTNVLDSYIDYRCMYDILYQFNSRHGTDTRSNQVLMNCQTYLNELRMVRKY